MRLQLNPELARYRQDTRTLEWAYAELKELGVARHHTRMTHLREIIEERNETVTFHTEDTQWIPNRTKSQTPS